MSEAAELLGLMVRAQRERRGLTLREAAVEVGISASTLFRCERAMAPTFENYLLIHAWLHLGEGPSTWLGDSGRIALFLDRALENLMNEHDAADCRSGAAGFRAQAIAQVRQAKLLLPSQG